MECMSDAWGLCAGLLCCWVFCSLTCGSILLWISVAAISLCLICKWCQLTDIWVGFHHSGFYCAFAIAGGARPLQLSPYDMYTSALADFILQTRLCLHTPLPSLCSYPISVLTFLDLAVLWLDVGLLPLLCGFIVVWFGIAGNTLYSRLLFVIFLLRLNIRPCWVPELVKISRNH